MKKEIFAATAIALLLIGAIINVYFVNAVTDDIARLTESSRKAALEGRWQDSLDMADEAVRYMDEKSTYLHMVLRHDEFDAVYDALEELIKNIYSQDTGAVKGQARIVLTRLDSAAQRENVSLGSVF
ncbi:MAG: DUF4363 family protein [Oscillospiraceae bacterium]|nr:DUF4363 family protein [Oscillospiraceae bacterium]